MRTRTTNASGLNRPTQLQQMLPIKQIKRKKSPLEQVSDFSDSDPERPPESASEDDGNALEKPDFKRQRGSSSSKHPQRSADIRPTQFTNSKSETKTSGEYPSNIRTRPLITSKASLKYRADGIRATHKKACGTLEKQKLGREPIIKHLEDTGKLLIPQDIPPEPDVPKTKRQITASPKLDLFEIDIPPAPKFSSTQFTGKLLARTTTSDMKRPTGEKHTLSNAYKNTYSKNTIKQSMSQKPTRILPPHRRDRKNEAPRRCSSPNPQPNLAELLPAGFLDTEFLPLPAVSEEVKNWRRERRAEKIAKESPNKVRFGKIGDIDIDELVREAAGEKDAGNEMVKCSTCNQMILSSRLKAFSEGKPLSVRRMIDFCELHTRQDAEDAWAKQKLPKIEWDCLALRVRSFKDTLADIVTGKCKSEFRNRLSENIKAHQKLNIATERPPLGYYGIRGMYCVQEVIYSILGKMIQKQALTDKVVSSRGWMFFTESVLVPEALIRLIMEDKDMDEIEALECLKSTTWIGDALSQEVQDVVEPLHHEGEVSYFSHDSEEDDEDEEGEEDEEAEEEEERLRAIQERARITHDFDRDFADSDDEP
ncbi:hypothetical protein CFIMG_003895RAa [Ceratocystis fimbriata CBS 114723]|uniref:Restriction of telomere capping protein 4 n=1 Tax=Ceratocystis fimbriata CBS 114723 TaxID=1035309 RepID=A0A2C5XAQ5_9PEZI|nr:hypothetical protein CFIMG_003895RAa [Ceratocystis fimbriata CBS 114723]